jgi:hypothetical protein
MKTKIFRQGGKYREYREYRESVLSLDEEKNNVNCFKFLAHIDK